MKHSKRNIDKDGTIIELRCSCLNQVVRTTLLVGIDITWSIGSLISPPSLTSRAGYSSAHLAAGISTLRCERLVQ